MQQFRDKLAGRIPVGMYYDADLKQKSTASETPDQRLRRLRQVPGYVDALQRALKKIRKH